MKQKVIVLSGINFVGKTWHEKHVMALPEAGNPVLVDMDVIRGQLYGTRPDKHITKHEHLYKNECVRNEVLRHIILGAPSVMVNSVMQTRQRHQEPFVEMIRQANTYVGAIAKQSAERDGTHGTDAEVVFLPVLLYCSLPVLINRIQRKSIERQKSNTLVFDLAAMENSVLPYQHPNAYEPLFLDTSDESLSAHEKRMGELKAYLADKTLPRYNWKRRGEMEWHHDEICAAVMEAVAAQRR